MSARPCSASLVDACADANAMNAGSTARCVANTAVSCASAPNAASRKSSAWSSWDEAPARSASRARRRAAARGEHGARGVERRGGGAGGRAQGPAADLRPHVVQGLRALREHELARRVRRALGARVRSGLGRLRADALRRGLGGRLGADELVRGIVHLAAGPLERAPARLGVVDALEQRVQKEVHQGDALVEGRAGGTGQDLLARGALEDLVHLVVVLVLAEELEVEAEVLRDLTILQVLGHEVLVDGQALVAVRDDHA